MKIAIVGSRDFQDYHLLLQALHPYQDAITAVITGGARGADALAMRWSETVLGREATVIYPDWYDVTVPEAVVKYNRNGTPYNALAGLVRNKQIVAQADRIFAFWDGESRGTQHVIRYARKLRKPLEVVQYIAPTQLEWHF